MEYENKEKVEKLMKLIDGKKKILDELETRSHFILIKDRQEMDITAIDISNESTHFYKEEASEFIAAFKKCIKEQIALMHIQLRDL